jgi:flagellar biosynthesis/type III secretory pathway M-ring protein FliF/YscJ
LVSATANSAASSSFHNKTLSLSEFKEVSLLVAVVVVAAAVAVVVAGVLYYQQLSYLVLISIVYDYSLLFPVVFADAHITITLLK